MSFLCSSVKYLHNLSHHFTYYEGKTMRNIYYLCSSLGMTYGELYSFFLSFPFSMLLTEFFSYDSLIQSLCDTSTPTADLHQYGPQASVKPNTSGPAFNFIAETGLRPHSPKWQNRSDVTVRNQPYSRAFSRCAVEPYVTIEIGFCPNCS